MEQEYDYPDFVETTGYGVDKLGLCGINCYHTFYAFIPGVSTPNYTLEQLEEMERRMQFQSTPLAGDDRTTSYETPKQGISIHVPSQRTTMVAAEKRRRNKNFNPRPLAGDDCKHAQIIFPSFVHIHHKTVLILHFSLFIPWKIASRSILHRPNRVRTSQEFYVCFRFAIIE